MIFLWSEGTPDFGHVCAFVGRCVLLIFDCATLIICFYVSHFVLYQIFLVRPRYPLPTHAFHEKLSPSSLDSARSTQLKKIVITSSVSFSSALIILDLQEMFTQLTNFAFLTFSPTYVSSSQCDPDCSNFIIGPILSLSLGHFSQWSLLCLPGT